MKGKASPSNDSKVIFAVVTQVVQTRQHRAAAYQRVVDERKRPIRGLWLRNSRYYAQLTVEEQHTGQKKVRRVPLEGVTTPAQVRQKLEALLVSLDHLPHYVVQFQPLDPRVLAKAAQHNPLAVRTMLREYDS